MKCGMREGKFFLLKERDFLCATILANFCAGNKNYAAGVPTKYFTLS